MKKEPENFHDERLRQERETFNQNKKQNNRWFYLQLVMGYAAIIVLVPVMPIICSYIIFNSDSMPGETVTAAGAALFVDVLGIVIGIWKIVMNPNSLPGKLTPVTNLPQMSTTAVPKIDRQTTDEGTKEPKNISATDSEIDYSGANENTEKSMSVPAVISETDRSGVDESAKESANAESANWQVIGHAESIDAMTAINKRLFALTKGDRLWLRKRIYKDTPWGRAQHVEKADLRLVKKMAALAAVDNLLFAATDDNNLWVCEPFASEVSWKPDGIAPNIATMTVVNDRLLALTTNLDFIVRGQVYGTGHAWNPIRHLKQANPELVEKIVALTVVDELLLVATRDNELWVCDPFNADVSWNRIKQSISGRLDVGIIAMATIDNELFAATRYDELLYTQTPASLHSESP